MYRGKSLDATDDQKLLNSNNLNFVGIATSRYHVLTSIETASEDLRVKRRRESDAKDSKSTKNVELVSEVSSRNTSEKLFVRPTPTSILDTIPGRKVASFAATASISALNSSKKADDNPKKKPRQKVLPPAVPVPPIPSKRVSSRTSGTFKAHAHWMVIADLPDTVCGANIREFLEGFTITEIYGYYHYEYDSNRAQIPNKLIDVYVYFKKKSGLKAAMLRDGESLRVEIEKSDADQQGIKGKNQKNSKVDDTNDEKRNSSARKWVNVVASLHHISATEASWAKALSVKLENTLQHCRSHLEKIRSAFPSSLLCVSPLSSDKKWSNAVCSFKPPTQEEICSYSDYQKKIMMTSQIHKYNYHDDGDFYLDVHSMCGGVGYNAMSGYGNDLRASGVELTSSEELSAIFGVTEIIPILNESKLILDHLSRVTSSELIRSYSSSHCSECSVTSNNCVLDLAHRMTSMFLTIHNKLKCNRYLYSEHSHSS